MQDALAYGNLCPQLTLLKRAYVGNEDCLFINVFTPSVKPDKPLPVIFAIHGGAFSSGSSDWLGPELLLNRDIVLVTFNYRLGPLGFLSLANTKYPGNYGLKDQLLALQWVNRNIEQFGGNRSLITLYGHSAGAVSAHLHLLTSKSHGLFQRAIISSGSANVPWAYNVNGHNRDITYQFATKHVPNVDGNVTVQQIKDLLTNVDVKLLIEETAKPFYVDGGSWKGVNIEWAPVVEGNYHYYYKYCLDILVDNFINFQSQIQTKPSWLKLQNNYLLIYHRMSM